MGTTAGIGHFFGNTAVPISLAYKQGDNLDPRDVFDLHQQFMRGISKLMTEVKEGKLKVVNGIGCRALSKIIDACISADWKDSKQLSDFMRTYSQILSEGRQAVESGYANVDEDFIEADTRHRKERCEQTREPKDWYAWYMSMPWPERMAFF